MDAAIDAAAALTYRCVAGGAPDLLLKRLGVATPRRRAEFATLERLLSTMPAFQGAVLECGTHHGATLLGMAHVLRRRGIPARIYGLDSFEGFPEPTPEDALDDGTMHPWVRQGGLGDASFERITAQIERMGLADRIAVIPGFFEATLPRLASERFSLVHLDCDLFESYRCCLEFVYPRMLPGGYLVFDDYNSDVYAGAHRAVDEFFSRRPEQIQFFPDLPGRRYFTRMGGAVEPGARVHTPAVRPEEERRAA